MERDSLSPWSGFILLDRYRRRHRRAHPYYRPGPLQRRAPCGLERGFVRDAAHAGPAVLRSVHLNSRSSGGERGCGAA